MSKHEIMGEIVSQYGDIIAVEAGSGMDAIECGAAMIAHQITESVRVLLDRKQIEAPLTIQWEIKERHGRTH